MGSSLKYWSIMKRMYFTPAWMFGSTSVMLPTWSEPCRPGTDCGDGALSQRRRRSAWLCESRTRAGRSWTVAHGTGSRGHDRLVPQDLALNGAVTRRAHQVQLGRL